MKKLPFHKPRQDTIENVKREGPNAFGNIVKAATAGVALGGVTGGPPGAAVVGTVFTGGAVFYEGGKATGRFITGRRAEQHPPVVAQKPKRTKTAPVKGKK